MSILLRLFLLTFQRRIAHGVTRRVLGELVPIYQTLGRGCLHRLEPLFRVATEILEGDNLGVIETALITIGLIGRFVETCN